MPSLLSLTQSGHARGAGQSADERHRVGCQARQRPKKKPQDDTAKGAGLPRSLLLSWIVGRINVGHALWPYPMKLKDSFFSEPGIMVHTFGDK